MDDPLKAIRRYHEESKHHPHRFAPGPGCVDWESQPDPFRRYQGAPQVELPLVADSLTTPYGALFDPFPTQQPAPFNSHSIAALFELSLGLAAWKAYMGVRWALRCNPSSGNLHPTEGYAVLPTIQADQVNGAVAMEAGIYHYQSHDHLLEQRQRIPEMSKPPWNEALGQETLLVGLASIHWRESWKYGERAYRYCRLNEGHAIMAVRLAAASLGWDAEVMTDPGDDAIARLLGLPIKKSSWNQSELSDSDDQYPEPEHPDLLLCIRRNRQETKEITRVQNLLEWISQEGWQGTPNRLSPKHMFTWPKVAQAARDAWKPDTTKMPGHVTAAPEQAPEPPPLLPEPSGRRAATLIRQRRSAQRYDGKTTISRESLFRILDTLLPRCGHGPWNLLPWQAQVHPVLTVQSVEGLNPGLYTLPRHMGALDLMMKTMSEDLLWQRISDAPEGLPLYLLREGDFSRQAETICCRQEIAADGALSLGMLGAFDAGLEAGPWGYRRLFWEAGALGQGLDLEAEAAGVRGTGIGCYFDDAFHQLHGIKDSRLQSLYHFTIGGAIEDNRLQSDPPYGHLNRN